MKRDVVSAFHQLQKLHQEFRDTGPVAKELRDEIWARFKAASTTVNRRHQQHFEALKEVEQHNLDQKTVICEIIEAIDYKELTNFASKTIGPVAKKYSDAVWKRFISACDYFFEQKNKATSSSQRSVEQENLEKKKNIIEKLNAIDDQMDTEEATQLVRDLMKEWNGVGHVPFKRERPNL